MENSDKKTNPIYTVIGVIVINLVMFWGAWYLFTPHITNQLPANQTISKITVHQTQTGLVESYTAYYKSDDGSLEHTPINKAVYRLWDKNNGSLSTNIANRHRQSHDVMLTWLAAILVAAIFLEICMLLDSLFWPNKKSPKWFSAISFSPLLIAIAGLLLTTGIIPTTKSLATRYTGTSVTGYIAKRNLEFEGGKNIRYHYFLTIQYHSKQAQLNTIKHEFSDAIYHKYPTGHSVTMRVMRDHSGGVVLTHIPFWTSFRTIVWGMPGLITFMTLFLLIYYVTRRWYRRRLAAFENKPKIVHGGYVTKRKKISKAISYLFK
ncbi:hypothetical protein SIN07_08420 [Pediococcus inopinatus]|uniref:hypothetical protein n=1 Tax=Pediococcus inopinatus TaxID=114090 RepID=UPI00070BF2F5|nr:hypothetical protein [Pediococcus inopinatus]AVK99300.1 hypothetical protein PI20285_00770 [Pediococcus inopinatus]KRN60007.1 hypothetical protein IV83_GL001642 [Pediococcus inopinatus]WPP09024.1 hypothetical protein SIN07_08420 [Pediococcus inopinatus]